VLQYFVGDFPEEGDFAPDDLLGDGVEEGLVEVVFEEVADEIVGVVAGSGVAAVVEGEGHPVFASGVAEVLCDVAVELLKQGCRFPSQRLTCSVNRESLGNVVLAVDFEVSLDLREFGLIEEAVGAA
jgi:hypothetical protein